MEGRGLEDETKGFVYASPVLDKAVPKKAWCKKWLQHTFEYHSSTGVP